MKSGPDIYLKPVGTWSPDPVDCNTTIEFGFDIYQEFVCAFIHQETLTSECSDHDLMVNTPAVHPLWPKQFADWQNRGEYSYRHDVEKTTRHGRLIQVTTCMYKSNDHHGFLTGEYFGRRAICSPERCTDGELFMRRRNMWRIRSATASASQFASSGWHGARGFRSIEELRIGQDTDTMRMDPWLHAWASGRHVYYY